jgi:Ca2+-binding RTX toxin-like protein
MSGEVSPATATEVNFDLVVTPVADGIADFKPTYSFNQTGNPLTTLNLNIGMWDSERVNNAAYDENAELTRLQLTGIPNGLNTVFLANGAMIDPSRISLSGATLTIVGLTQAELDNLQILHSPTAGKISITAAAQTYEVDASGAEVHTSGWTSAASAFDLQVTGTAPVNGTSGNDTMNGTAGNDILNGLAGNDILNGNNGNDVLNGGDGDDTLNGGAGNDYLIGGIDNDILNGDAGNDMLMGGAGNDTLNGGADNDILQGGTGSDSLTGGTGSDTFVWGANDIGLFATPDTDTITDFNLLGDKIDATALLTALGWNGNDATLSQFVSASGTTINIHDTANTKSVNIVVTGQSFADFEDMISKTNFQT